MTGYDVAVIGAGASGFMAAITSARAGAKTILLEAQARGGAKILASGNGRCNLSHRGFTIKNFHSRSPHFPSPVLQRFGEKETLQAFREMGLETVLDERDRYYPQALQAGAVVDILRFAAQEAGVDFVVSSPVTGIRMDKGGFRLQTPAHTYVAKALVMAAGGKAGSGLGGSEAGYELLEALGHERTPLYPGIVQLKTDLGALKSAKGQKWVCGLTLSDGNRPLMYEKGEVLFTSYGLSGPGPIQVSSLAQRLLNQGKKPRIEMNFFPDMSQQEFERVLQQRQAAFPQRSRAQVFIGLLPRIFGVAALSQMNLRPQDAPCRTLSAKDIKKLANLLMAWPQVVQGTLDFKEAQVTLGGIAVEDFNPESLESWMCPGLFACGEVLDVDGDCGGYNLQWAWSSGFVAGTEASLYSRERS